MAATPILLELDLAHGLRESPPADLISALRDRRTPVLPDVVERLRRAAERPEVGALVAHVGAEVLTASQVEELGAAVEAFSAAGKRTYCWSESFGEVGAGTLGYHLAAHFDEVWLQPSGDLGLVGLASAGTFLRGALDHLGVEPQIHQRHEFKNAADSVMRESMSDAHREALQRLTDSLTDQVVETIVRRRGLSVDDVRAAIDAAPLPAAKALEAGLIDHAGYRDEVYAAATEQARSVVPGEVKQRFVQSWSPPKAQELRRAVKQQVRGKLGGGGSAPVIAVVEVEGAIVLGPGSGRPGGNPQAGSDPVCAALRQAANDDSVRGVLLRVDSPGGSYVASDAIHRQVGVLREAGKPVVASMGSFAASGGYFVAMGAEEIVALPSTLTGSIGVFGGKLVVQNALERIGVGHELVANGAQATMWSPSRPFTAAEAERLDQWLDGVYEDFTQKAAEGRGMDVGELEPLARGRVWTGADALQRGLVDRLGGLEEAVQSLAGRIGADRDDVTVRRYPHLTPVSRLRTPSHSDAPGAAGAGALAGFSPEGVAAGLASVIARGPEAMLEQLSVQLGLTPGALRMAPVPHIQRG